MAILKNSNHPVFVKKVALHIWRLRDEIESVVRERYEESLENGKDPFIDDLQEFYTPKDAYDPSNLTAQGLDSCGNPLDEDAAAMLAAIQGDETQGENTESETSPEGEEETPTEDQSQEDKDAEDMAKAMLEGQVPDSDAEAMAKEMLADQGGDDADAIAAAMLADQGLGDTESKKETRTAENFKRRPPEIEKISGGFCLLADLNMEHILFFAKNTFLQGQTIAIEFQIPKKFIITCQVLKSTDIQRTSKIISNTKPGYRIQAEVTYNYPGERSSFREFLKSIEPVIPPPPKKVKQQNSEDEEDEFEDLGF